MSPLLFLAIAVVVPLLGMLVLGVGARLKQGRETDDETEPFRQKLESIAPREPDDPAGAPGLMGRLRRRGTLIHEATLVEGCDTPGDSSASPQPSGSARSPRSAQSSGPVASNVSGGSTTSDVPVPRPRSSTSIRLIEREYSLPTLPPFSATRDDRPSSRVVGPRVAGSRAAPPSSTPAPPGPSPLKVTPPKAPHPGATRSGAPLPGATRSGTSRLGARRSIAEPASPTRPAHSPIPERDPGLRDPDRALGQTADQRRRSNQRNRSGT